MISFQPCNNVKRVERLVQEMNFVSKRDAVNKNVIYIGRIQCKS